MTSLRIVATTHEDLPAFCRVLAPTTDEDAWVARQDAQTARTRWARLLQLRPDEQAHWDRTWAEEGR